MECTLCPYGFMFRACGAALTSLTAAELCGCSLLPPVTCWTFCRGCRCFPSSRWYTGVMATPLNLEMEGIQKKKNVNLKSQKCIFFKNKTKKTLMMTMIYKNWFWTSRPTFFLSNECQWNNPHCWSLRTYIFYLVTIANFPLHLVKLLKLNSVAWKNKCAKFSPGWPWCSSLNSYPFGGSNKFVLFSLGGKRHKVLQQM